MTEMLKLLQELQIDSSIISKEDLKNLLTSIPVSESEDDLSESRSLSRWTPEPRGQIDPDRLQREIKHIRDDYERQLRDLTNRIKEVQQEKRTLEDALEISRINSKNEIRAYQEATKFELEEITSKYKKLQQEAPAIKERISGLKEELRDVLVSEDHYFEIKKLL